MVSYEADSLNVTAIQEVLVICRYWFTLKESLESKMTFIEDQ